MCGIFGIISGNKIQNSYIKKLAILSRQRGRDSSGFLYLDNKKKLNIKKYDQDIKLSMKNVLKLELNLILGHSRLITSSTIDNQPVTINNISTIHNGIILNSNEIFKKYKITRRLKIDTEIIPALFDYFLKKKLKLETIIDKIAKICKGTISCGVLIPKLNKIILFSNNGSLYYGKIKNVKFFASEKYFLEKLNCKNIQKIKKKIIDYKIEKQKINIEDNIFKKRNLVPKLINIKKEEKLLIYKKHNFKRCSKCILPSTMPYIKFDSNGICNYCNSYSFRNKPKYDFKEAMKIFEKYRNSKKLIDCIVPLSGGRDSCIALHLAKKKFRLNPIAYTYDWGLVTDLARRNISRMCYELKVEHVIFADNIEKKRSFIRKNILAWLKKPHLGMVNLFTAGDKHFFRHIENLKKNTNIKLDLWGINPLEITHFKSGHLNIPPDFLEKNVYSSGFFKQLSYHSKRFYQMILNPSYFNSSILDNLYGEYYRSINKKNDHYSIFDFWEWDEKKVEKILNLYNWERATDTTSTWRIGDGAAAFYNYIYYTMSGFTEHDTFRSNQIREKKLTRSKALKLVENENYPRYQNIKWFLNILNLNYEKTIKTINNHKLKI